MARQECDYYEVYQMGNAETLTKNTNYTTPSDGYAVLQKDASELNTWAALNINGKQMVTASTGGFQLSAHIMNCAFVRKGSILYYSTNSTSSNTFAKFYPLSS